MLTLLLSKNCVTLYSETPSQSNPVRKNITSQKFIASMLLPFIPLAVLCCIGCIIGLTSSKKPYATGFRALLLTEESDRPRAWLHSAKIELGS